MGLRVVVSGNGTGWERALAIIPAVFLAYWLVNFAGELYVGSAIWPFWTLFAVLPLAGLFLSAMVLRRLKPTAQARARDGTNPQALRRYQRIVLTMVWVEVAVFVVGLTLVALAAPR